MVGSFISTSAGHLFLTLLLAAMAGPALSAPENDEVERFPGVASLMNREEFKASGLYKLDDSELASLNKWLLAYTAGEAEMLRRNNKEVRTAIQDTQWVGKAMPPFSGWDGNTLFILENGQTWRQRQPGKYRHTTPDTEVSIRRNVFGFYVLTVTSTGRSIGVEFVP